MPTIRERNILSGMLVNETMRRQVVQLPLDQTLAKAINHLICYKCNALLVIDEDGTPKGVVSKTDIMGAFYAGLPVMTPLSDIMVGPPLFCYPDDELESALDIMRQNGVHRLYVRGSDKNTIHGTLAYPDIVGQIYRICRVCSRGVRKKTSTESDSEPNRARVKDAVTRSIVSFQENDSLADVVEALSAKGFGAVLITETQGRPVGVISKTDLIIAYHHGISPDTTARSVMSSPVNSCCQEDLLVHALRQMLARDVQRLFVHDGNPDNNIIGVLSLSDAAQFRSGTCRACMPSRAMAG